MKHVKKIFTLLVICFSAPSFAEEPIQCPDYQAVQQSSQQLTEVYSVDMEYKFYRVLTLNPVISFSNKDWYVLTVPIPASSKEEALKRGRMNVAEMPTQPTPQVTSAYKSYVCTYNSSLARVQTIAKM